MDQTAFSGEAVIGVSREVARTAYGVAHLAALPGGGRVPAHAHDAPYLSIYLLGGYREIGDDQDVAISGPAAVFHPAGAAHEDAIGGAGLRTLVIQFDPDWLERRARLPDRSTYWTGGAAAAQAGRFAKAAMATPTSVALVAEAAELVSRCCRQDANAPPPWLSRFERMLAEDEPLSDPDRLARRLDLSLPWLLRAYRAWRGEGLPDTLRRRALEQALMLIEAKTPLAEAAAATGFCDQSHLTRVCRAVLGETPGRLREEGLNV